MKLGLIASSRSDLQKHRKVSNRNAGKEKVSYQRSREFAACSTKKLNFYIHIF